MKEKIKSLGRNKFFQGGIYLTVASFATGFLNYLFNSLTGKLFGPSGYGEIAALFSYAGIFGIPIQVLTADLIRRLGTKGEQKGISVKTWEIWFWQRLNHWKFFLVPFFLSPLILPSLTKLTPLFSFTLIILIFISFISILYLGALQAMHLFFAASAIGIFAALIKLIGPVFVFFKIDGLTTVALFLIISSFFTVAAAKIFLSHRFKNLKPKAKKFEKRIAHVLFNKQIFLTLLSVLGINFLTNLDVIFVKRFFTPNEAGIYSAWNLFSKMIFYLVGPIAALSYIYFTDRTSYKKHPRALFFYLLLTAVVGTACFLLYSFFGDVLIKIIFSSKFSAILYLLPRAALFGTLFSMIAITNSFFVAKNSRYSLVSFFLLPFYAIGLYFKGSTLDNVIVINIISLTMILIIQLLPFAVSFLRRKNY